MSRRIAVFTGTRADYGLLYWILHDLRAAEDLDLQLIVSGTHLSPAHGETIHEIETDGFEVAERVEMLVSGDTPTAVATSIGLATTGVAHALERLRPEILLLLGDRYEVLAAAAAATVMRVPIAHLHGGESTQGAMDEAFRHAVTKMAHLHLVAAEPFRRRVVQLGEDPANVHVVGAPGLDHLYRTELMTRDGLEQSLGWSLGDGALLVTYHPVTLEEDRAQADVEALVGALARHGDLRLLVTRPNADTENHAIRARLDAWADEQGDRVLVVTNLGSRRYLTAIRESVAVVGNSSSGLIEAPALGTPTVNIGSRQAGRLRGESVLNCDADADAIDHAIATARQPEFRDAIAEGASPYGDGRTAPRVARLLRAFECKGALVKRFHDVEVPR